MKSKRPRGAPRKDPDKVKRIPISCRVTPEFKAKLDAAAKRSGRSLAQEQERLIELGMIFETLIALGQQRLLEDD
jgi:hypothetical protein